MADRVTENANPMTLTQSKDILVTSSRTLPRVLQGLQREIVLNSAGSVYTGLSYALSEALPIMERLIEMRRREVKVVTETITKCDVYKDNSEDTGNGKTQKYR